MGVGFGWNAVFNRASPSSYDACVGRIAADYLSDIRRPPPRVLDIGGTDHGFRSRAGLPPGTQVVIANPERGVGAEYDYVSSIGPNVEGFDLALLFGVMMYIERAPLIGLMRDVRQRLRGAGTLLIAEPDPEGVVGQAEVAAKTIYAAVRSLWDPTKFHFHTKGETAAMLREAGFVRITERPDLTPNAMKVTWPPPQPRYFVVAAAV